MTVSDERLREIRERVAEARRRARRHQRELAVHVRLAELAEEWARQAADRQEERHNSRE